MALPVLHNAGRGLNEAHLAALESRLGCSLPSEYRSFLAQANGGFIHHENVDPVSDRSIGHFYGVCMDFDAFDLEATRRNLCDHVPEHLLAIASDSIDDELCIRVGASNESEVYIWPRYPLDPDIDFGFDDASDEDELEPIASSLGELLGRLELRAPPIASDLLDLIACSELVRLGFESVHNHDVDKLQELLGGGLDPNAFSNNGQTLLGYAAHGCRLPAIKMLLQHGADINLKSTEEKSPLIMGVYSQCRDCLELLSRSDADLEARDKNGTTPLLLAIKYRYVHSVDALLRLGASPRGTTADGKSYSDVVEESYAGEVLRQDREWLLQRLRSANSQ